MSDLVWISDWQIQCCGEEFAVGDQVTWPVLPATAAGPVFDGTEFASALVGRYEAHEDESPPLVSGTVRAIRTVGCRYAPGRPEDRSDLSPVPGTTVVEPVEAIERWYGTAFDPLVLMFCGWLVELDDLPLPVHHGM